ncbi:hypothetical protein QBC43DRAFT_318493 [Cladorrhinum sp. PSN259]|nr:hypothetical protein QBC43DRAFT_318493 [Cladorrhinum sp. PSN259]
MLNNITLQLFALNFRKTFKLAAGDFQILKNTFRNRNSFSTTRPLYFTIAAFLHQPQQQKQVDSTSPARANLSLCRIDNPSSSSQGRLLPPADSLLIVRLVIRAANSLLTSRISLLGISNVEDVAIYTPSRYSLIRETVRRLRSIIPTDCRSTQKQGTLKMLSSQVMTFSRMLVQASLVSITSRTSCSVCSMFPTWTALSPLCARRQERRVRRAL